MQSLSKYNKGIKYLLCGIDLFSKYAWIVPLKDKKETSIVHCVKHRNFTSFPGVEILPKGTVSA